MKKKLTALHTAFLCVCMIISACISKTEIFALQQENAPGLLIATASKPGERPASVNDLWRKKYSEYVEEEKARSTPTPVPAATSQPTLPPYSYGYPVSQSTPFYVPPATPSPAPTPTPIRTYGTFLKQVYITGQWDSGFTVRFVVDSSVVRSDTIVTLDYAGTSRSQILTTFTRVSGDMYSSVYETQVNAQPTPYNHLYISLRDYRGYYEYATIPVTAYNGYPYPTYYPGYYDPNYNGYYGYGNVWSPFLPYSAAPTVEPTATPDPSASPGVTASPTATATPTASPTTGPSQEELEEDYLEFMGSISADLLISLNTLNVYFAELNNDPAIINDSAWVSEFIYLLREYADILGRFGSYNADTVPDRYKTAHDLFSTGGQIYIYGTEKYTEGLRLSDDTLIAEGEALMQEALYYLNMANAAMPTS